MIRSLPLLSVLLLPGCAEHWARPGGTAVELRGVKAECETESFTRFPPVLQQVMTAPGYFSPQETSCTTVNGRTQCRTVGGLWVPPSVQTIDMNLDGRRSARIACMTARGWILADSEKEAAAITAGAAATSRP